jgi:hypothetical protein
LWSGLTSIWATAILQHTSFGDLGKGQASAPLEIDIIGIDEGTQGSQGFSGEEISFGTLSKRSQGLWLAMFIGWRGSHLGSTDRGVTASGPREIEMSCDVHSRDTPTDPTQPLVHCRQGWFRRYHPENALHPGRP